MDDAAGVADSIGADAADSIGVDLADETAFNIDPNVASDAESLFEPAQYRPTRAQFPTASADQLSRLTYSVERANMLEMRVREVDPNWKLESALTDSDPSNIEAHILRYDHIARQATERLADYLRETYDAIFPRLIRFPNSVLTGRPARILRKDDLETRCGAERENDSTLILWLRGHNVEQKPSVPGRKNPDYRIDGEIFDNYAPRSGNARNVWNSIAAKVNKEQAPNIILNLRDSVLNVADLKTLILSDPIPGLNRLWIIEKNGSLIHLLGAP